jgi:hypothetical protein
MGWIMPALFTNASIRPNLSSVSSTALRQAPELETSAVNTRDFPPNERISPATSLSLFSDLEMRVTAARAFANQRATAAPNPLEAPVTITTGLFLVVIFPSLK